MKGMKMYVFEIQNNEKNNQLLVKVETSDKD